MSVEILQGDCLDELPKLAAESVDCCVTSPPYWGLRDYNSTPRVWGGDAACEHDWQDTSWRSNRWGSHDDDNPGAKQQTNGGSLGHLGSIKQQYTCDRCGAWLGCLGLEPTPQMFVDNMVAVFAAVRGALRDDGTLWLNLGDSYNAYNGNAGPGSGFSRGAACDTERPKLESGHGLRCKSLKPKDLVGIPWRVALALQADGWYLRQDIIWHKPNPMPESVQDRCTKAHEYIFLLSKSERYYFNSEAIQEASVTDDVRRPYGSQGAWEIDGRDEDKRPNGKPRNIGAGETRNKRSVWTVTTKPYKGAHFATFPPDLIKPCILAGCPEGGVVLDPFFGSGTTGQVATECGCNCIGIELNEDYCRLARRRNQQRSLLA